MTCSGYAVAVNVLRLERARSSLDRPQRCQSDRVKEGFGKKPTRKVEVFVVAGHDQDRKGEHETSSRRAAFGRQM